MPRSLRLLLVSGSLRAGSTNTAVLETARTLAPHGVTTVLYRGMAGLPHFNPDDDREGEAVHGTVAELRAQVAAADALLICTPEYAGALPGALKNCWSGRSATLARIANPWRGSTPPAVRHRPAGRTLMTPCARCWATSAPTSSMRPACVSQSRATLSARAEGSPTRRSASRSLRRLPRSPDTSQTATSRASLVEKAAARAGRPSRPRPDSSPSLADSRCPPDGPPSKIPLCSRIAPGRR